ncbi:MAG: UDP-N-acetylglucosamine 1-carboxyvinyltransferase [Clostridia bacterium]|nr:UDP-N-acetylglucosamine 1-carboxyvinyltransferase [Clostridia bacterium]
MSKIVVNGGKPLSGVVKIHGAKNAVLPILAATVMTGGVHTIQNCPALSDVSTTVEILQELGARVEREGDTLIVDTGGEMQSFIPERLMRKLRSSIIFMGAILARKKEAKISAPGGCELGPRPIDLHIKALRELGAQIEEEHGYLICRAQNLKGTDIHLDIPSVGATENIMLAACAAKGTTVISNAAREPEIEDLANYLNSMGARISGAGTSTIVIEGGSPLSAAEYRVMPDRIVAATYLCAAAATGGSITVTDVCTEHLSAVLAVLSDCGCKIKKEKNKVSLVAPQIIKSPGSIKTMPYPGFPTDAQSLFLAMLAKSDGTTLITETIFESRFKAAGELLRMGAKISVDSRVAVVKGSKKLSGACVTAQDLRGGAALVVAALAAEGRTEINSPEFIYRGYEKLEENLKTLGADIAYEG